MTSLDAARKPRFSFSAALAFLTTTFLGARAFAHEPTTWQDTFNTTFNEWINGPIASIFFFDIAFWDNVTRVGEDGKEFVDKGIDIPFVVAWLVIGATYFTIRFAFINLRAFGHAIAVTRGKFDHEGDEGEVNHFQALSSALSATVGLGNIAGVAVAVAAGGPGAVFWMIVAGTLGMTSKFTECTLGQMYRRVENGKVSGGPFRYLEDGLREKNMVGLGKVLAVLFAILCIGGSFGGGNMFQANQSARQLGTMLPFFADDIGRLIFGLLLALLVAVVILGGIRRIGTVAGVVVPFMCVLYLLAGMWIILQNTDRVTWAVGEIFSRAFSMEAGIGGFLGVLVQGFKRAAFSNEAGVGSASIAHSAAATNEPIREGIVALLEPFIDTIVVCTMTALVIVITGAHEQEGLDGVKMTSWAFGSKISWFPALLTVAVFFFAFSTMISWSYYGERSFTYLFGDSPNASRVYRSIFLVFVVAGAVLDLGAVMDFSDLMILGMAFPNVLGMYILSGKVGSALNAYMGRLKSGEMKPNA